MAGTTVITAVSPVLFTVGVPTAATSVVLPIDCCASVSSVWFCCAEFSDGSETTTVNGPFVPGPKPVRTRSYARRMLSEVGFVPASICPSRNEKSGNAKRIRTSVAPIAHGHGRSLTLRPHRAKALRSCASSLAAARAAADSASDAASPVVFRSRRSATRSLIERTFTPATPMNAGISVRAASIVTATTTAEARPIEPTNGTPET